jgi:hypothetical protein
MENQKPVRAKTGDGTAGSYAAHTPTGSELAALTFDEAKPVKKLKFAPAREDGLKPYVREERNFGKFRYAIVNASNAVEARNSGYRARYSTYSAHRATPEDLEKFSE